MRCRMDVNCDRVRGLSRHVTPSASHTHTSSESGHFYIDEAEELYLCCVLIWLNMTTCPHFLFIATGSLRRYANYVPKRVPHVRGARGIPGMIRGQAGSRATHTTRVLDCVGSPAAWCHASRLCHASRGVLTGSAFGQLRCTAGACTRATCHPRPHQHAASQAWQGVGSSGRTATSDRSR